MDFPKYEENEILKAVPVSISAQANVVKNRTMRGQALWYVAPGRGELREAVVAPAGSGKVRVRALFGAISRGTERLEQQTASLSSVRAPSASWWRACAGGLPGRMSLLSTSSHREPRAPVRSA